MNSETITVQGTLDADGVTVQLEAKVDLPPGRVTVTVQPLAAQTGRESVVEVLARIHQQQRERGRVPPTEEEMAARIAELRDGDDEYEEYWRQIWAQTRTHRESE